MQVLFWILACGVIVWCAMLVQADEKSVPENVTHLFSNQSLSEIVNIAEQDKMATYEDVLSNSLDNWEPPEYIRKNFPFYLSGFDDEDRPIFIAEVGKFNIRELVSKGPEATAAFEKYAAQTAKIITESAKLKNPEGDKVIFIADMEGFKYEYFADIPTLAFMLRLVRYYRNLLEEGAEYAAIVNANYVTQTLVNILRPVLGRALEIIDVFGTDKSRWIPKLLRRIPRDSLPEWYGGLKHFTPVKVYP